MYFLLPPHNHRYFLLMRRTPASISDISTTFMGVFYAAYLPFFCVRLRCLGLAARHLQVNPAQFFCV
jgi:hypothetical protein